MPDESVWQEEARAKELPEEFIRQLQIADVVTEKEKAALVASVKDADDLTAKRAAAVELGRRYGENEASRRRETGADGDQRIRRAMAYAAWEFDGKPASSEKQRKEFGVAGASTVGSLERIQTPRLVTKK